jgi:hypothetical protein
MRLASVVLAAAALAPTASARAPVTCRYRMDYRGDVARIQVMHHNLSHETIPFRSQGVLTVRLTDSASARHLELFLDPLAVTRADGSPLPDAEGGAGSRRSGDVGPDGEVVADGKAGERVDTTAWATSQNGETGSEQVISTLASSRAAPAFPSPVTTTGSDSLAVTGLP